MPPPWLWSRGKAFHLFRLRGFTVFWCCAICVLGGFRLVHALVAALHDGGEVTAWAACVCVIAAAALVVCVVALVHVAMLAKAERAVYWTFLSLQLLCAADLLDLDGTELEAVQTTFVHMSFLAGMLLTLVPVGFELSILKVSVRLSSVALVGAHITILCFLGLPRVVFGILLLCVGLKCVTIRLDALELDAILQKTMPDKLTDTLAEIGEINRGEHAEPALSLSVPGTISMDLWAPSSSIPEWTPNLGFARRMSIRSCKSIQSCLSYGSVNPGAQPIRILSIDGGGSKGVGVFKVLDMLESTLGKPLHELYDFFIGSSIGGAVLVGKLVSGYDFDTFYARLVPAMARFGRGQSMCRLIWMGSTQTEEETTRFLCACMDEDTRHGAFDGVSGKGTLAPIAITTCAHKADGTCATHLIRNYDESDPWEIGEVVRATTSFPTVCPPFKKNGQVYLDGGLLANNPSLEGFRETSARFPGRPIAMFHSIGMGGTADSHDTGPDVDVREPMLPGPLRRSATAILSTIADTQAGTSHVKGLLGAFHPMASLRRLDLPLSHHALFAAREAEYAEITQETISFLGTSQVYQDMLGDHMEHLWPSAHGGRALQVS